MVTRAGEQHRVSPSQLGSYPSDQSGPGLPRPAGASRKLPARPWPPDRAGQGDDLDRGRPVAGPAAGRAVGAVEGPAGRPSRNRAQHPAKRRHPGGRAAGAGRDPRRHHDAGRRRAGALPAYRQPEHRHGAEGAARSGGPRACRDRRGLVRRARHRSRHSGPDGPERPAGAGAQPGLARRADSRDAGGPVRLPGRSGQRHQGGGHRGAAVRHVPQDPTTSSM